MRNQKSKKEYFRSVYISAGIILVRLNMMCLRASQEKKKHEKNNFLACVNQWRKESDPELDPDLEPEPDP